MNDTGFTSFSCEHCHAEIEASPDLIGQEAECPACGARLVIPAPPADGVMRHGLGDDTRDREALKSRTIRIELDDL